MQKHFCMSVYICLTRNHAEIREMEIMMKVRDAIKMIEADGWYLIKTRGSYKQYKHHTK